MKLNSVDARKGKGKDLRLWAEELQCGESEVRL